jgi:hypothetical protein
MENMHLQIEVISHGRTETMTIKTIGKGGTVRRGRLFPVSPDAKKVEVKFSQLAARAIQINSAPLGIFPSLAQGVENGCKSQAQSADEISGVMF